MSYAVDNLFVSKIQLDATWVKANLATFAELAVQNKDVTIDMSAVELVDASGFGALVYIHKRLRSAGHHLKLANVRDQPLSFLKELGVADILLASLDSVSPLTRATDAVAREASGTGV